VVELALLSPQAGFDIAQALAIGELSERHAEILIEATERFHMPVALVARDAATEAVQWQMSH
jgi:hypothetical protein